MKRIFTSTVATLTLFGVALTPTACAEEPKTQSPPESVVEETTMVDPVATTAATETPQTAPANSDIVDTAIATGQFTTLMSAIQAAGLEETLRGPGPFTVLAPTDDAFAKLDKATLEALLQPDNIDQLKAILTYHVIPGKVTAADLSDGQILTTANGANVTVSMAEGPKVNNSFISQANIKTSNGIIHVIDAVLIPEIPQN